MALPAALFAAACSGSSVGEANGILPEAGTLGASDGASTDAGTLLEGGFDAGAQAGGPEPNTPWAAPGIESLGAFPSGVQSGDVDAQGVMLSVRTNEPLVDLRWVRAASPGPSGSNVAWVDAGERLDLTPQQGVVQLELDGLLPDTTYAVAAYAKDGTKRSRVARFRTALAPGQTRTLRFGATSCLGNAGAPFASMSKCLESGPLDFFCLLGDTVYSDGIDDLEGLWKSQLAKRGLLDVTSATSVIATWDDHEVDNNWSWSTSGIQARRDAALLAFNRSIPHRDGPAGAKLYRSVKWGDAAEVFVLDCRDERRDGLYISVAQMEWLKQSLLSSTARFKIVLNSVPITDFSKTTIGNVKAGDRWQGYAQRAELLEHIAVRGITGVFWLSGDFHFGQIARVSPPGALGSDEWEVLCGPSGSNINVAAYTLTTGGQISAVVKEWNSVLFDADPAAGTIRVRFIGDSGATLADRTLTVV